MGLDVHGNVSSEAHPAGFLAGMAASVAEENAGPQLASVGGRLVGRGHRGEGLRCLRNPVPSRSMWFCRYVSPPFQYGLLRGEGRLVGRASTGWAW